jgi:hypothetical protein
MRNITEFKKNYKKSYDKPINSEDIENPNNMMVMLAGAKIESTDFDDMFIISKRKFKSSSELPPIEIQEITNDYISKHIKTPLSLLNDKKKNASLHAETKISNDLSGLSAFDSIPVDAFNRAIWNDVAAQPNPYGTRSPWASASQPLSTPPGVAAMISGLTTNTGLINQSSSISPLSLALNIGATTGVGLGVAAAAGKTLGFLANLSPSAQKEMQRMGAWAGMLTGIAQNLTGR